MASSITKKNGLCRYFIRYGDCFHGENCQYIHALPPQSSPQHQPMTIDPQLATPIPQQTTTIPAAPQQQLHAQPLQQTQQPPQQQGYSMNKLICSFKSDLPNEIDFAMQVSTLLANTDNFTWSKDYPIVDAICSSMHVFICTCKDAANCYCYPKFWHKILSKHSCNQYLQAATVPLDMEESFLNFESLEDHDPNDHHKIFRRIKTAAELIKQFSFTAGITRFEKNEMTTFDYHQMKKKKAKASPSLLKFVSLLYFCDDIQLNLIGLDILSNIASKLAKIPESTKDPVCLKLVQMFQESCVDNIGQPDGDIYIVNRSIEVVSKLISSSSRSVSSNIINIINDRNLIYRIEQFLTSHHDVSLFLTALECCYRVSRHQPHLLTAGRTRYLIKILVNLLNCDDSRYFTQNALKRIKLVDEDQPKEIYQTQPKEPEQIQLKKPNQTQQKNPQPQVNLNEQPNLTSKGYVCEWDSCKAEFDDAKQVYSHVFKSHIEPLEADMISSCLWSSSGPGCVTKRPKFSLLTHLNDFHCNQAALEQPIKPPEHPGYAPNAALLAIRRHANAHSEIANLQNRSPLSISVRLTAALILRNLATESPEVKQALQNHEPFLSEICMTNGRDESKIIAECLSLFSKD